MYCSSVVSLWCQTNVSIRPIFKCSTAGKKQRALIKENCRAGPEIFIYVIISGWKLHISGWLLPYWRINNIWAFKFKGYGGGPVSSTNEYNSDGGYQGAVAGDTGTSREEATPTQPPIGKADSPADIAAVAAERLSDWCRSMAISWIQFVFNSFVVIKNLSYYSHFFKKILHYICRQYVFVLE
jgi:hypothetical protein